MKINVFNDCRVISLTGEIVCEDPPLLASALHDAKRKDIVVYIASPGGYTTPAMAIYDLFRAYPGYVTTVAVGDCFSAAAEFLLQAGDHRMATVHTLIMLHEGTVDKQEGPWPSVEAWMKLEKLQREKGYQFVLEILQKKKPIMTMARLKKMLQSDWILTAEEALEWGLIDEILTTLP